MTATDTTTEEALRVRIRDAAIDQIGRHGFRTPVRTIAGAAGVPPDVLLDLYGSKQKLVSACDEYIAETVRTMKSDALQSTSPELWFAALDDIGSFAPMMAYLVRSLDEGGSLGRSMLDRMIENAIGYLEAGVRAGTLKPSRDPRARATFLALNNAGGFLLYLRRHATPKDMAAVLRDYANDMIMPALEIYTHGLLADTSMITAFDARMNG
ncbi:TetR family transcriptional regulator [Mycolicibacterium flavescens]|uniref:TetR family transcriptional regulator n=1 Tax=Mycolicibacterium flavescens TaxID=1776 RepID=A0A1E3R9Q7_MYCFV|nr:TetR family transcriptional regulator [Mycolicibacterium flavescens]MCV7282609.1 TetR family transcriptional regulator [Mycolicibacterium flavescens]ODQ86102.1 TetR family transcriptional regulator [Mycolicibacterium flavescens]